MNSIELKENRKKLKLTQTGLADLIGRTTMRTVQNWESGINKIPDYVADLINEKVSQLNTPNFAKETKNLILNEPSELYHKGVPYYDVDFTASFLEVTNNQSIKPDSYIDHPFFKGCDYVVRASGQSMAKVISHGDAIGLVRVNNWREFFPFGEIYAIVTVDNFRMIKVITKGETDEYYTLISKPTDSKKDEFPPQQIKRSAILSILKVQASSHLF